jgi:hypothetical protein
MLNRERTIADSGIGACRANSCARKPPGICLLVGATLVLLTLGACGGGSSSSPVLTSVLVKPVSPSVDVGNTQQFSATAGYSDGSNTNVTTSAAWTSSNPAVASVLTTGQSNPGLASGIEPGSATILASYGGLGGETTLSVVIMPVVNSLAVAPIDGSVNVGSMLQFNATAGYSDGSTGIVTTSASWSSSNAAIASIQSTGQTNPGLASGVMAGNVTITVSYGGFNASTNLTVPLPLGMISGIASMECGAGFSTGAICQSATVSCPKTVDIGVTWGTVGSGTAGRIVVLNGNGDTVPDGAEYATQYTQAGFVVTQIIFASDWEDGGDLLAAACRPATVLDYFHSQTTAGAYCAQGISAGSGAIGYGLAWYGLSAELDNVELTVGPVFSNIVAGCEVPYAPPVTVIPTNGASFVDDPQYNIEWPSVSTWTATSCLPPGGSSAADLASEAAQSTIQPGALLNYPHTSIAAWDCNNGLNPSAAQSYLFLQQVTTPWALTSISGCTGAEGTSTGVTPQGVPADTATGDDMVAQCVKH